MKEKTEKKKYRLDVIIISSLLIISLLIILSFYLFRVEGNYVTVEVDGVKTGEYSLYKNGTYILNGGTNTLVIEMGEAYLINSNCPDHTCEVDGMTGKVRYVGQTIVCLPNKLTVTVVGDSEGGVDLVS